jgi:hypothetical protein
VAREVPGGVDVEESSEVSQVTILLGRDAAGR